MLRVPWDEKPIVYERGDKHATLIPLQGKLQDKQLKFPLVQAATY